MEGGEKSQKIQVPINLGQVPINLMPSEPPLLPLLGSWLSLVMDAGLTAGRGTEVCVYSTILRVRMRGPAQVGGRTQAQVRRMKGLFPNVSQI